MTPCTVAHQAPPPMGFSRQEHWSGLLFPSPEDLPHLGIEPVGGLFTSETPGKPITDSKLLLCCAQLCPTLCDSMDCSLPDLSVHEIFQTRILECLVISYSRGSSRPRGRTHVSCVSCVAGRFFTTEPPGNPKTKTLPVKSS